MKLHNPRLWSIEQPQSLCGCNHNRTRTDKEVDRYETPFGIRTIQFTADNGFLLNGRRVPLKASAITMILARWARRSTPAPWSGRWSS